MYPSRSTRGRGEKSAHWARVATFVVAAVAVRTALYHFFLHARTAYFTRICIFHAHFAYLFRHLFLRGSASVCAETECRGATSVCAVSTASAVSRPYVAGVRGGVGLGGGAVCGQSGRPGDPEGLDAAHAVAARAVCARPRVLRLLLLAVGGDRGGREGAARTHVRTQTSVSVDV